MVQTFPGIPVKALKTLSAYHLYGKSGKFREEFKWNGSFRWNVFGKKVIPSEVFLFLAFTRIPGNFSTICPRLPVPGYFWEGSNARKGGFKWWIFTVPNRSWCDSCFILTGLLTDFLQHNCSTQGENDLSFGRRYFCFTLAFMIRAFEFNGAGKHLHPKPRIKWYCSIRSVFFLRKSAVPFVQKNPTRIPFKWQALHMLLARALRVRVTEIFLVNLKNYGGFSNLGIWVHHLIGDKTLTSFLCWGAYSIKF